MDSGLDYGLDHGLDFGLDSIMYKLTSCFRTFQAFSACLIASSLVPKARIIYIDSSANMAVFKT